MRERDASTSSTSASMAWMAAMMSPKSE